MNWKFLGTTVSLFFGLLCLVLGAIHVVKYDESHNILSLYTALFVLIVSFLNLYNLIKAIFKL